MTRKKVPTLLRLKNPAGTFTDVVSDGAGSLKI